MSDKGSGPENQDAALKARLDSLSGAIKAEKRHIEDERKAAKATAPVVGLGTAMGTGFRVTSELLAGVLAGGFIGWWIDRWLGSSPWAFLIMIMIGMVSGFWNVYRIASRPTVGVNQDSNQASKDKH